MKESKIGVIPNNSDKHTAQIGLYLMRLGLVIYAREYWKYKSWFVFPGVTIDAINGYDAYLDVELKVLFLGFGIRFIWRKKKKDK